jgi:hypothetical protein
MDVEIRIPPQPVALTPGAAGAVTVELTSLADRDLRVRLSVAASRAGAWAHGEPPTVSVPAGGTQTVEIAVRPPATAAPTAGLLPFTVQADDSDTGTLLGRATGLVSVAAPARLAASLFRTDAGPPARFTFTVRNPGERLAVTIAAQVHPPGGRVRISPDTVDLAKGGSAAAHVEVRPPALFMGGSIPYVVSVSCKAVGDLEPLVTVEENGQSPPRIGKATAFVVTALLVATAAGALAFGGWERLASRSSSPPAATDAQDSTDVRVRAPYAMVEVFQRTGAGPADADAALGRLTAAGVPVRLVDSTRSPDLADGPGGLLVLLQDGFASPEDAQAYCDRNRTLAPRCQVVR